MKVLVSLTSEERNQAVELGKRRNTDAIASGRQNAHDLSADENESVIKHILGVMGEMVVKKYLDIPGELTINTYKTLPDVGVYEVRTRKRSDWELNVRHDDPDDAIYILVVCSDVGTDFEIKGWLRGKEAKQTEWLRDHGGREFAFFAPHHALHHIDLLKPGGL